VRRDVRTGGFETVGGYARAVRVGSIVAVSGTAATTADGEVLHPGDAYLQTRAAFERALAALHELGGKPGDVVRTRIFLVPDADWRRSVDAHRELFGEIPPANTTLFVAALIPDGALVEVEVDAVVDQIT
jgi:enamine deaminase RidA (YjgF/YER057c/UK114 family)